MNKLKLVLFVSLLVISALSVPALGQSDPITLLGSPSTTSQSAVLAAFIASIDDGTAAGTALSVSNILGRPAGSGFPDGQNESGALTFYLFSNIGTVYSFNTGDNPDVGTGLNVDGTLSPGSTYSVNLSEILEAMFPDRVPADRDFAGYAWIVADFDAVAGTFFNFFPLAGGSQAFQMVPTAGGLPVQLDGNGQ